MNRLSFKTLFSEHIALGLLIGAVTVSACAPAPRVTRIYDPAEVQNRKVHHFNKALDRSILKPLSGGYGRVTPGPVGQGISNFASNLSLPGAVVNDLLQLNLADALTNTTRFTLNSTFGLFGVLDVATQNGLAEQPTDFGKTLHVWGVSEGAYVELPFFGPSTERDTLGTIVDFALDPVGRGVKAPKKYIGTVAKVLKKLGDRHRYGNTVDSILYDSQDSYAQARLLYLQSRRREIFGSISDADLEDPYAQ